MPDRVIIWTEDAGVAKQARESVSVSYPGATCLHMNPRFYPGSVAGGYAANVVCVGPDARKLVSDYESAGVTVVRFGFNEEQLTGPPAPTAQDAPQGPATPHEQPTFRRRRRRTG